MSYMLFIILMRLLDGLIDAYITVLFIRMILDWVAMLSPMWRPRGFVYTIIDIIYRITDPPLNWLRRYIPPLRLGPVALDLSFIVLYFLLVVLRVLI
ncbi:hemolysin [Bifidobacterium sp. UTCIF-37]|nr:hemolysin [Bifidobacterium sp. UTCIF-37]TPF88498.1 hemolysin [Bifidobacterium sp. UTCIF-38]